jgi:RimJ/RimL family protein N-acetyltransferase
MMGRELMNNEDQARVNFNWLKDKEEKGFALEYKRSRHVIGNLTVTSLSKDILGMDIVKNKFGVSMSFSLSRFHQRQGLMEEALRGVIDKLFQEEGLDFIHCGHFDFNIPSANLQKKLGFEPVTSVEFQMDGIDYRTVESILWRSKWLK